MRWPSVELGEVIEQDRAYVDQLENRAYKKLSVKLYGRGAVLDVPSDGSTVKMSKHQLARSGQIILSEIWAKKGAIGIVPDEGEGALTTSHFYLFNITSDRLNSGWIKWLLRANYFEPQLAGEARGSTGYASVRPKHFLKATIPLPPVHEQEQIVARLDAAAKALDRRRASASAVEAEIAATLRAVFSRIIADVPRARMGDIAPLVRRPIAINPEATYPELGVRSFGRGLFAKPDLLGAELTWQSLFRIEAGDLVFSNIKAWEGAFAVAEAEHHGKCGSHRYLTCVPDPERATAPFLWFYLQSEEGMLQIRQASPGSADRNRTFATKRMAAITVPAPSLDAQLWFDGLQLKARAARSKQREATEELDRLLPAMLHEVFGG